MKTNVRFCSRRGSKWKSKLITGPSPPDEQGHILISRGWLWVQAQLSRGETPWFKPLCHKILCSMSGQNLTSWPRFSIPWIKCLGEEVQESSFLLDHLNYIHWKAGGFFFSPRLPETVTYTQPFPPWRRWMRARKIEAITVSERRFVLPILSFPFYRKRCILSFFWWFFLSLSLHWNP